MTNIDLSKWCGADDPRPNLRVPFTVEAYTYATNGHVAIRVPAIETYAALDDALSHSVVDLFAKNIDGRDEFETVVIDKPEPPRCVRCVGTGQVTKCPECHGEGKVWYEYGHCHDCPECGGSGDYKGKSDLCADCDGEGIKLDTPCTVGRNRIQLRYARLIESLPGLVMGKVEPGKVIPFRFDGGACLVMPLDPKWFERKADAA